MCIRDSFNSFQWDLNYANPAVFRAMAEEMLFIANTGVEILRLDAVAFIWKRLGTNCENQPEAHQIIQAFNSITRIAAPAMLEFGYDWATSRISCASPACLAFSRASAAIVS